MKVLLVGTGGVGEAIVMIAREQDWVEQVVLADYRLERAIEVGRRAGDPRRFPVEALDASNQKMIEDLARKYQVDLIMNAVDPLYNQEVFDAAYHESTADWMDCIGTDAVSPSPVSWAGMTQKTLKGKCAIVTGTAIHQYTLCPQVLGRCRV